MTDFIRVPPDLHPADFAGAQPPPSERAQIVFMQSSRLRLLASGTTSGLCPSAVPVSGAPEGPSRSVPGPAADRVLRSPATTEGIAASPTAEANASAKGLIMPPSATSIHEGNGAAD